jgi:carboxypeptidase PM20D1
MTFGSRLIAANLWLFGPLVRARMIGAPPTAALLRSTSAITRLEAGSRLNVLPNRARATAVFFVHPSESTHQVLERVRRACGDSIEVRVLERAEPTPRAATDSHAFGVVARSIRETFPDALVAPSLLVGNVDARHYVALSDHVFRFTPIVATRVDLARIHGSDERIGLAAHGQVIRFYLRLLRNVQAP